MPASLDSDQPRRRHTRADQSVNEKEISDLLNNRKSKLTKVDELSSKLNESVLEWLPESDYLELCDLLPPIDLYFIRRPDVTNSDDDDDGLGDNDDDNSPLEEIIEEYPKNVEDAIRMKNDPRCVPCIKPEIFKEPAFKETVEDWQVLLAEGMLEPSDDEEQKSNAHLPPPQRQSSRKRSWSKAEDDGWKDDNFEAYWGERLQKQRKSNSRASGTKKTK
ncbi:hypothetical protein VTP01DRAFT_1590 [Rhizomucor pusillus]|uniref:uncharacterized protein n=1 Tax=Rhizomucor pusillus TaxID=4840 RepID=UPI003743846A